MSNYLNLNIKAPQRLAILKRSAATGQWVRPMTWRDVRFSNFRSAAKLYTGYDDKTQIWYSHSGPVFRREKFANEIDGAYIDHRGWCTNEHGETFKDGSGLARGIVVKLPHGRYIAGYWWGDNGERVYFPEIYDDEADAAQAGDSHAKRFAELQRDDDAKFNEARRLENEIEEKTERRKECLLLARINHRREQMRDEARELRDDIMRARERLNDEFSDYL